MARPVTIRRSLLINVVLVVVLLGATILVTRFISTQRALREVSESLMTQAMERVDVMLAGFFDPVARQLGVLRGWSRNGMLDLGQPEKLDDLLEPFLLSHPWVVSLAVADDRGREYRIYRLANGLRSRVLDRDTQGDRTRERIWLPATGTGSVSEGSTDYDPRSRPWFIGALSLMREQGDTPEAGEDSFFWTAPYMFFESGDPGISVATAVVGEEGGVLVLTSDLLLQDISRFTSDIEVGDGGKTFVLSEDGRLIGLPRPLSEGTGERQSALLKLPAEVGTRLASDAAGALLEADSPTLHSERFESEGEAWWGEVRAHLLPGSRRRVVVGVVVPERGLLGNLARQRIWVGLITLLAVGLAVVRSIVVADRYSEPIEKLVAESNRIGAGDLASQEPIESDVTEVRQLTEAHDRMRVSLRTLLKIEKELQLAQEIQEKTFPEILPEVDGYDLAAWNEPADETGGDSYDVIGFHEEDGRIVLEPGHASRLGFLLADATGHGIGPALSVTQLRAMLRMAVRLSARLSEIVSNMNEQLCADLPAGRFITAWIGHLDPSRHELASFSAGQAPLLLYRAATERFEVFSSDAVPLGLFPGMRVEPPPPLRLEPGDLYAAISDGIFEAERADEEEFGVDRVQEVIRRHRQDSCDEIVERLREAVDEFTGGAPAADDKTIVLIRRTA